MKTKYYSKPHRILQDLMEHQNLIHNYVSQKIYDNAVKNVLASLKQLKQLQFFFLKPMPNRFKQMN